LSRKASASCSRGRLTNDARRRPDHRLGRRDACWHRFISILALGACAVLSGARSFIAITEWAMDLTPLLRAKLGIGRSRHVRPRSGGSYNGWTPTYWIR
jgi:hypothetical protein